jgi:hypothetical protein
LFGFGFPKINGGKIITATQKMGMIIDKAGQHQFATEIDHFSIASFEWLIILSDVKNFISFYCHRIRPGIGRITRPDPGVKIDFIGWIMLALATGKENETNTKDGKGFFHKPDDSLVANK